MEPLKTNKLLLTWLSMCEADKLTNRNLRTAHVGAASMIFALNLFCLLSTSTFFIVFISVDLKGAFLAFMSMIGLLSNLYTLMNAFSLRYKIREIFEKLSEICCQSEWI